MDIKDIGKILLYDPLKYQMYLDYRNNFPDTPFLCFEEFLLCEKNLKEYLDDPEGVFEKYKIYHEGETILDHECYELFCKMLYAFPYNEKLLEDLRSCDNCIYQRLTKDLETGYEYYSCAGFEDDVIGSLCDSHIFDTNKVKPIIRELRK